MGQDSIEDIIFQETKIFKDKKPLLTSFIPDELQDRDIQRKELAHALRDIVWGYNPHHLLLVGPNGTGKTVTVNYVLKKIKENTGKDIFEHVYVKADGTSYEVAIKIANCLGLEVPTKGMGFNYVINKLEESIDKITVIVLDEIEKLLQRDGDSLLYHLSRIGKVSIIGITVKNDVMSLIKDSGVKSSFNPKKIAFPEYKQNELIEILKYRSRLAFHSYPAEDGYDVTINDGLIQHISAKVEQQGGDCRLAINVLRTAGEIAETNAESEIEIGHIKQAFEEVDKEIEFEILKQMSFRKKLLLWSIYNAKTKTHKEVYLIFNSILKKTLFFNKKEGLSERRIRGLLRDLRYSDFVEDVRDSKGYKGGVARKLLPLQDNRILEALEKDEDLKEERIDLEEMRKTARQINRIFKGG